MLLTFHSLRFHEILHALALFNVLINQLWSFLVLFLLLWLFCRRHNLFVAGVILIFILVHEIHLNQGSLSSFELIFANTVGVGFGFIGTWLLGAGHAFLTSALDWFFIRAHTIRRTALLRLSESFRIKGFTPHIERLLGDLWRSY